MKRVFMLLISMCFLFACTSVEKKQTNYEQPSDKKATKETVALYNNLKKLKNKGIMFGHQDDLLYGIGWKYDEGRSDVKSVTGDYAAVHGFEIGHLELGRDVSLDSVHFAVIRDRIKESYERGGVSTISWHADNPLTGGSTWDFSNNKTVKSILPGGENSELYITWLNKVADFVLSLTDEKGVLIPVIFRPYHEHMGSWFWWGKDICTIDEYKQLWYITVDHLKETRNVHNLLYAYSNTGVETESEFMERYPGDEYVDLIGFDTYQNDEYGGRDMFMKVLKTNLDIITKVAQERNKIPVLSEGGYSTLKDPKWFTETLFEAIKPYKISYALVWRNAYEKPDHYYAPYPGHPAAEDFIQFKEKPIILFESDLPDMYHLEKQ